MNKNILLKTLLPIATVALLGGGIASSLTLTSCRNKDPSHYIGNMVGTDWKGWESGEIRCIPDDDDEGYTLDLSSSSIAYSAANWVIPYKVKNPEGEVFNVKKIKGTTFSRNDLVLTGTLTIPNSVTSIGDGAFVNCSGLTGSLTIPNSVISIATYAFSNCTNLTGSLTIGSRVRSIATYAFSGCTGLTGSLTIPNSVTSIAARAFNNCTGLTGSLTIGSRVTSIGTYAFSGCTGLTGSLTIPSNVTSIAARAFIGCSGFINITLVNFTGEPGWGASNIFEGFSDTGTVSVSGGSYTADEALTYLISKGLPSNWTFA